MSATVIVRLIEPDGTLGLEVTYDYAVRWCEQHPGWSWEHCGEGPLP